MSCDACLKGNFRGRRFKCLICYDYDLCASCYESGATTTRHTTEHPMQCILTRVDYGKASAVGGSDRPEQADGKGCCAVCPCRPVLWWRHVFSGAAAVVYLSLLWKDGLHGDVPPGPRHLRTRRNLHRGGECCSRCPTRSSAPPHVHVGPRLTVLWTSPHVREDGPSARLASANEASVFLRRRGVVPSLWQPPRLMPATSVTDQQRAVGPQPRDS